jgi:endonuclease/exonuclease/phosphatase (EEP) superfamily protein YafD
LAFLSLLRWTVLTLGFIAAAGTLASLSRHPHWGIRIWDFPKLQIALFAAGCGIAYALFFFDGHWLDVVFLACMVLTVGWQTYWILPYTPLAASVVEESTGEDRDSTLRIITTNVLQKNLGYQRWMKIVMREDPDLILCLETDEKWEHALSVLAKTYPYSVRQIQDNTYGIILFSRLPLENTAIRFIVQEDIPSIHADILLRSGDRIRFYGVHPRPPEPIGGEQSTARDVEMVLIGRETKAEDRPTVIIGDLNDVAWSKTTDLFLSISGLLDPRLGRGFYNTFPTHFPFFLRFPLDHVFHSDVFRLIELRILDHVGSDHFPVLVHLSYEPEAHATQPQPEEESEDREFAREKVQRERA